MTHNWLFRAIVFQTVDSLFNRHLFKCPYTKQEFDALNYNVRVSIFNIYFSQ